MRRVLLCLLLLPFLAWGAEGEVRPGRILRFPADQGSHPTYGIEWWYVTGWLTDPQQNQYGFQITFFRMRNSAADQIPGRFAPRQLLAAHVALSDPRHGKLRHDDRVARIGFNLAGAEAGRTAVWLRDWRLVARQGGYDAQVAARDFGLRLRLTPTQPPMLNGEGGFSRKGKGAASYYYSEPHLAVTGSLALGGRAIPVTGRGWLDHEWSDGYMPPDAVGWDWVGLNLKNGGALMAFQMRGKAGRALWASATLRHPGGKTQPLGPDAVTFTPLQFWRSPRTGARYPVAWRIRVDGEEYDIRPLLADQEQDTRRSTGTVYWEGPVTVWAGRERVGEGYLELTGYQQPLQMN